MDLMWLESAGVTATGGPREALHRRSEGVTATGGPREALSREVRGSHSHRRSEGAKMMEAEGTQKVHRERSRSARRPDVSGSHSRSISDSIRSSWFLPSYVYMYLNRDLLGVSRKSEVKINRSYRLVSSHSLLE